MREEGTGFMKCRDVLWYMVFSGFAITYMVRITTNITIVDMIDKNFRKSANKTVVVSECIDDFKILNKSEEVYQETQKMIEKSSMEKWFLNGIEVQYPEEGFKWNEHETGQILGAYFWLHWLSQLPGGILATKYGTKLVFGLSNLFGSVLCSLMPMAAYLDYRLLIFLRVLQGFIAGCAWPAMHNLTAQWIPQNERSKFVTAYLGSSIGAALNYPIFGFIMKHKSWEYVYHFCSVAGVIWYVLWYFLVFDSPNEHPRIHQSEKEYILTALGTSVQQKNKNSVKRKIPWMQILTSRPIWMNCIAQWGGIWGLMTMLTQAPTFFRYIHGWGVEMTGVLSGVPHFCRFFFALGFSIFADYLLRTNKMSRTNVRKFGVIFSCFINGVMVLFLAFSGCDSLQAIVFMTLSSTFHGAVSAGQLSSIVDLAPNYAAIILGIIGMISVAPGFLSPMLVSYLTFENQTVDQWKIVFLITGLILTTSGVLYVLFADSTEQKWNKYDECDSHKNKEVICLKVEENHKVNNNNNNNTEDNKGLLKK